MSSPKRSAQSASEASRSPKAKRAVTSRAAAGEARRAERDEGAKPHKTKILVLSGPNLQLLGTREPEIYGKDTLADIHKRLKARGKELGATVDTFQSNHEGDLLDRIGKSNGVYDGMLLNAAALTHTSLALFDALKAVRVPCVEVHLSNPEARESYRRESKIAPACVAKVSGFGADSYLLALEGLVRKLLRAS